MFDETIDGEEVETTEAQTIALTPEMLQREEFGEALVDVVIDTCAERDEVPMAACVFVITSRGIITAIVGNEADEKAIVMAQGISGIVNETLKSGATKAH